MKKGKREEIERRGKAILNLQKILDRPSASKAEKAMAAGWIKQHESDIKALSRSKNSPESIKQDSTRRMNASRIRAIELIAAEEKEQGVLHLSSAVKVFIQMRFGVELKRQALGWMTVRARKLAKDRDFPVVRKLDTIRRTMSYSYWIQEPHFNEITPGLEAYHQAWIANVTPPERKAA